MNAGRKKGKLLYYIYIFLFFFNLETALLHRVKKLQDLGELTMLNHKH